MLRGTLTTSFGPSSMVGIVYFHDVPKERGAHCMKLMRGLLCAAALLASTAAGRAQTPVPLTVSGNEASGSFMLPASAGGPFRDVTRFVGIGSSRAQASAGGFSEFLIVADARPIDTVIASK